MKPEVERRMQEIMDETFTDITVKFANPDSSSAPPMLVAVDTLGDLLVDIKGRYVDIEHAKLKIMVFIDTLVSCNRCEYH